MKKSKKPIFRITTALGFFSLIVAAGAQAATATKQPIGTDLTWNTAGVWSGGSGVNGSPGSGDVAAWVSTSLGAGLILTNPVAWGGISASGALTDIGITGTSTLTNGSSGINISSSTVNFLLGTPVVLSASQTWVPSQTSGETLTVSSNISGSAYGLTIGTNPKSGPGTQQGAVLLAGNANSFNSVTLDNGTLESSGSATIGSGFGISVNAGGATVNTAGGNFTNNSAFLHGSGSPDGGLTVTGGNTLSLATGSTYTGGTRINGGTVSLVSDTSLGSSGTIEFTGNSTLQWGSSVTTDLSSRLLVDDGITATIDTGANSVSFASPPTLGTLGTGALAKQGSGTLTLSAASTFTGNTTINAGTLALGFSGSVANSGNIFVAAGAVFDVSSVSGGYTLGAAQTLSGNGSVNGAVTANGTLLPGGASVGTLTFNNDLTINSNLVVKLNKSLVQSNDVISAPGGTLTNSGAGTLTVTNVGTVALAVGDRFVLFSQPVSNGLALAIASPAGVTFTNNLAVDGSLTVLTAAPSVATNPTNITFSASGGTLNLSWPLDHLGWVVQSNSANLAVPSDWHDVSNTASGTNYSVRINSAWTNVFYRLREP